MADRLAGRLAEIRRRADYVTDSAMARVGENHAARNSAPDVPPLLAAVEAVLDAASRWEGHTAAYCADEARMLITRELLGEDGR